ncbi:glycoside hydrolase family 43 protein [Nocardioides bruguierae]|uniref:Glycoside hydrolase family 43 protein n=1 Tax=Nocardioides bruguierae TaxID=2945102 RepID=A0A9X2IGC6_9ACTN|nr:glycoside hydrolase family 43 protein [Nocardioides bruguierae]MCM0621429.1 glycoside hydrolase family 43 protein [Nocardioides bruguierae]
MTLASPPAAAPAPLVPALLGSPVGTEPVIPGFHPDPTVCRVGEWFYVASSSFELTPGVPIHRSRDLVTWELVGHALAEPAHLDLAGAAPSSGVLACTLRHHDGRFWLVTTNFADGGWQLITSAVDAAGPWRTPVRVAAPGIDPDLTWDDDGTCYLSLAGFGPGGPQGPVQQRVDPWTGSLLSERVALWRGTGGQFPEGPHLYRRGEHWYLLIAEGGTERGHAVTLARGPSPQGPWEPCPHGPLLTTRGTDHPVQNVGHADLVPLSGAFPGAEVDDWAIVFHGVRPRGSSPMFHVLGRETFASRVTWVDGWPVVTSPFVPQPQACSDVLPIGRDPRLPATWCVPSSWWRPEPTERGWLLRAETLPDGTQRSRFVGRRQQHASSRLTATLELTRPGGRGATRPGEEPRDGRRPAPASSAGVQARMDPHHTFSVLATTVSDDPAGSTLVRCVATIGGHEIELGRRTLSTTDPGTTDLGTTDLGTTDLSSTDPVTLVIETVDDDGPFHAPTTGPDVLRGLVVLDEQDVLLGELDGRYLSTEVAGGMVGRMLGLVAVSGSACATACSVTTTDRPERKV